MRAGERAVGPYRVRADRKRFECAPLGRGERAVDPYRVRADRKRFECAPGPVRERALGAHCVRADGNRAQCAQVGAHSTRIVGGEKYLPPLTWPAASWLARVHFAKADASRRLEAGFATPGTGAASSAHEA